MAAESYMGSLISLTSKSDIRYEGVLCSLSEKECTIGLRNVRCFGTEGRKKDGPQIPPNDKTYEYIVFGGANIQDLVVKSSPPAKTESAQDDPAIIQSQFSQSTYTSISSPSICSTSQSAQFGLPSTTFPSDLPLYQPGASMSPWGPTQSLPIATGSGATMSPPWPGYYASSSGIPQLQQSSLLQSSSGFPPPPSMLQPFQYNGMNAPLQSGLPNLYEIPSHLLPPRSSTQSLTSLTSPSTVAPTTSSVFAPETVNHMPNQTNSLRPTNLSAHLPLVPPLNTSQDSATTVLENMSASTPSNMTTVPTTTSPYQTIPQSVPSLVAPGQLVQTAPSTLPSTESLKVSDKPQVPEVKRSTPASPVDTTTMTKEPTLAKPTYHKPDAMRNYNYVGSQNQQYNPGRGRGERGRGRGNRARNSYVRTQYSEDFDFMAMNEKFNKDEIWGHLGKNKEDTEGGEEEYEAGDNQDGHDAESPTSKPVYVKDDFFDSLSCHAFDLANHRGGRGGRMRYSEMIKKDTETFGDFPSGGPFSRGRGRGYRGEPRGGGPYNDRGGYGYAGRGRGRNT